MIVDTTVLMTLDNDNRADESSCDVASLLSQQDPATIVDAEQVSPGQSAVSGGQNAIAQSRVTAIVVVVI